MRRRDEGGAVTAELAMGIGVLLAVTVALVWFTSLGTAQIRTVDASREAARMLARGDDEAAARRTALRIAPEGARVTVVRIDGRVEVTTSVAVQAPLGLLGSWGAVELDAVAVAADEEGG